MKCFAFVVAFFAVLAIASATEISSVSDLGSPATCELCVEWLSQAENELIQAIIQLGVVDSCGDLCGLLSSRLEGTVCDLVCDYVGVTEFVKIIQEHSPDPIYACQLLKQCTINDNAAANIKQFQIAPKSGPKGTTFVFALSYNVTSPTGAGEIALGISPPNGEPFGDGVVNDGQPVGTYNVAFNLQAKASEQEPFSPGTYSVEIALCNGECGSTKPHSKVLAVAQSSFQITQGGSSSSSGSSSSA